MNLVRETVENPRMKTQEKELGYYAHELRIAQRRALELCRSVPWEGGDIDLPDLLQDIHSFLLVNFKWDHNPLPHFRKYFPEFDWKYYNFDSPSYKGSWGEDERFIVGTALYIWTLIDTNFVVTATLKRVGGRPSLPIAVGWYAPTFEDNSLVSELAKVYIVDLVTPDIGEWVRSP